MKPVTRMLVVLLFGSLVFVVGVSSCDLFATNLFDSFDKEYVLPELSGLGLDELLGYANTDKRFFDSLSDSDADTVIDTLEGVYGDINRPTDMAEAARLATDVYIQSTEISEFADNIDSAIVDMLGKISELDSENLESELPTILNDALVSIVGSDPDTVQSRIQKLNELNEPLSVYGASLEVGVSSEDYEPATSDYTVAVVGVVAGFVATLSEGSTEEGLTDAIVEGDPGKLSIPADVVDDLGSADGISDVLDALLGAQVAKVVETGIDLDGIVGGE